MERKPPSAQKLAELADDYTLARRGNNSSSSGQSRYYGSGPNRGSKLDTASGQTSTQDKAANRTYPDVGRCQTNFRGERRCFQCGKWGHLMYNCPEKPSNKEKAETKPALQACSGTPRATSTCERVLSMAGEPRCLLTQGAVRPWSQLT